MMAGIPEAVIKKKKLSQVKDRDEKRYMIEDAVRAFKRLSETKREIREIKTDKELLKAVRSTLQQEIVDTKTALKT